MQPGGDKQGGDNGAEGVSASQSRGRQQRLNRQARVGILPNANSRPLPLPKPPPLTGRWQRLRSTRRPPCQADGNLTLGANAEPGVPFAPRAVAEDGASVSHTDAATKLITMRDGCILGVDIEQLTASVGDLGTSAPARAGFLERLGLSNLGMQPSRGADRAEGVSMGHDVDRGGADGQGGSVGSPDSGTDPNPGHQFKNMREAILGGQDAVRQNLAQLDREALGASGLGRLFSWLRRH